MFQWRSANGIGHLHQFCPPGLWGLSNTPPQPPSNLVSCVVCSSNRIPRLTDSWNRMRFWNSPQHLPQNSVLVGFSDTEYGFTIASLWLSLTYNAASFIHLVGLTCNRTNNNQSLSGPLIHLQGLLVTLYFTWILCELCSEGTIFNVNGGLLSCARFQHWHGIYNLQSLSVENNLSRPWNNLLGQGIQQWTPFLSWKNWV